MRKYLIAQRILTCNYDALKENYDDFNPESIPTKCPENIYHYSSVEKCSKILCSNDLWLFDSKFCNDAEEYLNGNEYLDDFMGYGRKNFKFYKCEFKCAEDDQLARYEYDKNIFDSCLSSLREEYSTLNNDWMAYITCFSMPEFDNEDLLENDILSMWRGYGNSGQGASLSFCKTRLKELVKKIEGLFLCECLYKEHHKEFFIKHLFRMYYDSMHSFSSNRFDYDFSSIADLRIHLSNVFDEFEENPFENITADEMRESFAIAFQCIPSIFKNIGFQEEKEVRLFYLPDIHKKIDKRVSFIGEGFEAKPYMCLSKIINNEDISSLIESITFGSMVCDKTYLNEFVKSGGRNICLNKRMQELWSKIPYRH